ncbi:TPA: phage tail protein, partial [Providencia rettgeri]
MKPFFTILTHYGKTALAEALAAQASLEIPFMAVGDGGGSYYDPTELQTNLRNERWRGDLNDLRAEDNIQGQVIAEAIIPHDIDGDWTAREVGLFDAKGGLIAVGKYPETYIPPAHSGAKSQAYINIIIQVDNVAAVSLTTNHDVVIASKAFVENLSLQQEIAFNNALTSNVYPVTNVVQSSGMNNSLVHALKNTVSIHKMYAMAKGGSVYVGVQMGDKTYPSAIEYKFDVNEDNLLLLRGVRGGLLSDSSNALRFNKPLFVDSTANINSAPNCYMTEIGSKITGQFFGNRFIFRGYKDNRGGMWKITLTSDTGMIYRKDLSTYKETAVTATGIEEDVFGKLPNATYQYELVFTGNDPKNPPASGQARGWFTYKPNDSQYQPVVTYDSMPLDESTAKWLSAPNSIIDFALSVKPNNSSFSARWVPVHGGVMGVSDRLNRKAYLDGIVIVDETTVKDFPLIEIESFRIDQMFFAKHPESPERLWTHFVSHTIKNGELSIENKLDFTSDTFV